ncbi:MAG: hypothetical protein QM754_08560 [Tepidisphaeraceae bacterium]
MPPPRSPFVVPPPRRVVGEKTGDFLAIIDKNQITRALSPGSIGWPWSSARAHRHPVHRLRPEQLAKDRVV